MRTSSTQARREKWSDVFPESTLCNILGHSELLPLTINEILDYFHDSVEYAQEKETATNCKSIVLNYANIQINIIFSMRKDS